MRRSLAAILGALSALNGTTMLLAGPFWYASVPGAAETGPYNPHFVQDIGAAFLITALRWRYGRGGHGTGPRQWPARVSWPPTP